MYFLHICYTKRKKKNKAVIYPLYAKADNLTPDFSISCLITTFICVSWCLAHALDIGV